MKETIFNIKLFIYLRMVSVVYGLRAANGKCDLDWDTVKQRMTELLRAQAGLE